ncbi:MAG: ATPase [Candidatus Magnetoglobus multicellularis str. Araruama]|uniref:ATPase n=1 Tax=Candidatus Magnetoglobus multicellularis str. Araruama TaxID=890399 RepID=A0A1V1P1E1_9BACT|nr:MAG: ATPase [Candidatus Magnetoglobus multicellularis str. Araruama]
MWSWKKELQKIVKKGKRPIIIIDELQALEDIYMNSQRELLKELFNFFVAITKESHLCHVIIASSDGYFMNRIYEDSKLTKTSDFYGVEYLNESDTKYWLSHLESESAITRLTLSETQIDLIWKFIGGSMWEISNLLGQLLRISKKNLISNDQLKDCIQKIIDKNYAKIKYYARFDEKKVLLFKQIYQAGRTKEDFDFVDLRSLILNNNFDNNSLSDELNKLVQLNYLAFNPTTSTYQLQGKSMFYGLEKFVKSMPDDLFVQND